MRRLRFAMPAIAAAAIATLSLPASPAAARQQPCRGASLHPTTANAAAVRHATLCLLNRQRVRHGLHRLRAQPSLSHAAGSYAHLMVVKGFFGHVSPTGSTMIRRIQGTAYLRHARGFALGENLAWGSGGSATPARIVRAWMHSRGHRANILDGRFREIGIGVALGAPRRAGAAASGATYATEFGRRSR